MTRPDKPDAQAVGGVFRQAGPVVQEVSIEISGAVPHPHLLSGYNQAIPDGADRVVKLVEAQVHHRQSMEARAQILTFALAVITLLGGITLIALGKGAEGLAPLVVAIAGLGGLLVYREVRSRSY